MSERYDRLVVGLALGVALIQLVGCAPKAQRTAIIPELAMPAPTVVQSEHKPPVTWAIVIEREPDPAIVTGEDLRRRMYETGLPWLVKDTASRIELVLVPPGTFMMGAAPDQQKPYFDQLPLREVTFASPFYIARTELTQADWSAVMVCNPSERKGASRPVECVSWEMARQFCRKTGLRLPTEAQWEYACQLGNQCGPSSSLDEIAWFAGDSKSVTQPVGQKRPNCLGVYDMMGNVSEWCSDWYGPYESMPVVDPLGPQYGDARVLRGGAFSFYEFNCRPTQRHYTSPSTRSGHIGMRPARNL